MNYSPLSLYYALALAASGAEEETEQELLELLGVENKEQLSEQCGNLYRLMYIDNEIGKMKLANYLWIGKQVDFKESYVENATQNFYASSFQIDFTEKKTGGADESVGCESDKWYSESGVFYFYTTDYGDFEYGLF